LSLEARIFGACGAVYDIRMRIAALDLAATPPHAVESLSAAVSR
jgi:hypothetical protein